MRNPLAPLSNRAMRLQASRDIGSQISPLVAQIMARTRAGTANIGGVANQLATGLAPYAQQAHDIYAGAESQMGALDTALANRLGTGGLANDLRARLAAAGGDTGLADALTAASKGAAGAGFATGGAQRGQLITQGALAADYAAKLPGFARLAGLQNIGRREAQGQSDLATLQSKVPGMITQSLQAARNLEYQKAVANLGFGGTMAKLQQQAGYQQANLDLRQQSLGLTQRGQDLTHADRQAAQAAAASAAKAKGQKATANSFWKLRKTAFRDAQTLYKGTAQSSGTTGGGALGAPPSGSGGTSRTYKQVPRDQAFNRLYTTYAPQMKSLGYGAADINRMLNRALSAAGYGSPPVNPQIGRIRPGR